MIHRLKFIVFALLLTLLAACGQTPGSSVSGDLEDTVGWFIGNVPATYWQNDGSGVFPSAIIDLFVTFKDVNVAATDLESVKITNSVTGVSWNYTSTELTNKFYTAQSTGKKRLAFTNMWTDELATNGSAIYLGTYTIEVTLKNGKKGSTKLVTPAPGALNAQSFSYAYSPESFGGTASSSYVALPRRATIQSASLNTAGDALALNFSVNDDKVYSGWVLFFDAADKYLGFAGDFRNFETEAPYAKLNNGQGLLTNGTNNLVSLVASDVQLANGVTDFTLSKIRDFTIVLTDGKQYVGTDSAYDTYSMSMGTIQ